MTDEEREDIFQLVALVLKARNIVKAKGVKRPLDQIILACGDRCQPVLKIIGYVELGEEDPRHPKNAPTPTATLPGSTIPQPGEEP